MPNRPSNPSPEFQLVCVNGNTYTWDPAGGLDPEAVEALHGLIHHIAFKHFGGPHHAAGLTLDDLHQVGRMGAMNAAKRWSPEGGATFATYAATWIRGAMFRATQDSLVHTPEGRERAVVVFADHTLDDVDDTQTLWDVLYWDMSDDFKAATPDQALEALERRDQLREAMGYLTHLQRQVIQQRYGLDQDGDGRSFAKIAADLHISPTQARAQHERAMAVLAHHLGGLPDPDGPAPIQRRAHVEPEALHTETRLRDVA